MPLLHNCDALVMQLRSARNLPSGYEALTYTQAYQAAIAVAANPLALSVSAKLVHASINQTWEFPQSLINDGGLEKLTWSNFVRFRPNAFMMEAPSTIAIPRMKLTYRKARLLGSQSLLSNKTLTTGFP
jgi:hypothetical protein